MMALQAISAFGRGKKTENAGTRIRVLVPGDKHGFTYLTFLRYTSLGTAHTLTMMRGQSYAKATAAVAEAGTSLVVDTALKDGAGNAIAANDVLAVELANGSWGLFTVSSWNAGTKTVTLSAGPAAGTGGIAIDARVVSYGVAGDSGHADYQLSPPTSATTNFPAVANAGPLAKSRERNEPIIIDSDNATAAGIIEAASAVYGQR